MGLSFRKSIKIGKNTKINLSKNGGIGVSTGVKHFRISKNNNGTRITASKNGFMYTKTFKNDLASNNLPNDEFRFNYIFQITSMPIMKRALKFMLLLYIGLVLTFISLLIPIIIPIPILIFIYVLGSKSGRQKLWLSQACYYLKRGNLDKAKKCLVRAQNLKDDNDLKNIIENVNEM